MAIVRVLAALSLLILVSCTGSQDNSDSESASLQYEKTHSVAEDTTIVVSLGFNAKVWNQQACSSITGISWTSDSSNLIDLNSITMTGTVPNCTLNIPPKQDANGTTTLSFSYSDKFSSLKESFDINISSIVDLYDFDIAESTNSGDAHMCAVHNLGLSCWGANTFGQTGNGQNTVVTSPHLVTEFSPGDVTKVDVGHNTTCVVKSDNTVWCIGSGAFGQLGNGGFSNSSSYVQVIKNSDDTPLTNIQDIESGYLGACAIDSSANLWCWGYNGFGGLGIGDTANRNKAVQVLKDNGAGGSELLTNVTDFSGGNMHNCAVRSDSTLWCWGRNTYGQLGQSNTTNTNIAVQVNYDSGSGSTLVNNASKVETGGYTTCYVDTSGGAFCGGAGSLGRVGNGSTALSTVLVPVRKSSDSSVFTNVADISTGHGNSCLITSSGEVWCWGSNRFGTLGNSAQGTYQTMAVQVTAEDSGAGMLTGAEHIEVGFQVQCFIKNDKLYCNGSSGFGLIQSGLVNSSEKYPVLSSIADLGSFGEGMDAEITESRCYKTTDARVKCVGNNLSGQLGNGSGTHSSSYTFVKNSDNSGDLTSVSMLSNGSTNHCAVVSGEVLCWGGGGGVNGNTLSGVTYLPTKVQKLSGGNLNNVTKVEVGPYHSCALDSSNQLWCWGSNSFGQLADNSTTLRYAAVEVQRNHVAGGTTTFNTVSDFTVRSLGTCAIDTSNQAWCWGRGTYGANGTGADTSIQAAAKVQRFDGVTNVDLNDVTSITSIAYGACAIRTDQSMVCWGYNGYGQLSNNSYTSYNEARTSVDFDNIPLTNITKVVGNFFHACALNSSNELYCWGNNKRGNIGGIVIAGSARPAASRVPLDDSGSSFLSNITDIDLSINHTCTKNTSNLIYCWGLDGVGYFGRSLSSVSNSPVSADYR